LPYCGTVLAVVLKQSGRKYQILLTPPSNGEVRETDLERIGEKDDR